MATAFYVEGIPYAKKGYNQIVGQCITAATEDEAISRFKENEAPMEYKKFVVTKLV